MITRQRRPVIGIALLLTALSGCAAGQVTQTANQESAVNGASGQAGPIAVRDAVFVYPPGEAHYYPAGSAVALRLTIVNTASTADRLAMVQSPAAGSVRLDGSTTIPGQASVRVIAVEVAEPQQTATAGTATSLPPPTSAPGPGTTTSGAPAPATTTSAPTTTQTGPRPAPGELTIVLEDLTEDIRPGRTVRVVLLFEQAGELVLLVPIGPPEHPRGESAH